MQRSSESTACPTYHGNICVLAAILQPANAIVWVRTARRSTSREQRQAVTACTRCTDLTQSRLRLLGPSRLPRHVSASTKHGSWSPMFHRRSAHSVAALVQVAVGQLRECNQPPPLGVANSARKWPTSAAPDSPCRETWRMVAEIEHGAVPATGKASRPVSPPVTSLHAAEDDNKFSKAGAHLKNQVRPAASDVR